MWTGLAFGDAWPFLAAGYGLFFLSLALGFGLIWRQAQRLNAQETALRALTPDKS